MEFTMQFKNLLKSITLSVIVFSSAANANIMFHSTSLKNEDMCANVTGLWLGTATVTAKVMGKSVTCDYSGKAMITATSDPSVFSADINLKNVSGPCDAAGDQSMTLPGTCDAATGVIALQSDEADLTGSLSSDGNSATLSGTVSIPIFGRTVKANVTEMNLHKS